MTTLNLLQGVSLGDIELRDGGAAQGVEMGSAAEALAYFVGDGAHISSGGDAGAEAGAIGVNRGDEEFFYFYLHRLQHYFFLFASEFVGGDAANFFGREGRRDLLDDAEESGGELLELLKVKVDGTNFADGFAIGIVSIGGEAEADHAFISFLRRDVKLRQPCEIADHQRKYTGGQRIERPEMADGALAENAAHAVDHVVGGPTSGLVDDDDAIHERINGLSNWGTE